jgi:hypothetical protein
MCAAAGAWCFGVLSRRSELHTIKGFAIAVAIVLTLSVGLAYAVKVNWDNHPAYSVDQGGAAVPVIDFIGPAPRSR